MTDQRPAPRTGGEEGTTHRLVPSVGSCIPRVPPLGDQRLRLTLGGIFPGDATASGSPTMTVYAYPAPAIDGVDPTWRGLREGSRCRIGPWSVLVESIREEPPEAVVRVLVEAEGEA